MRARPTHPGIANSVTADMVFDRLEASPDQGFTDSHIARAQRNVVWNVLLDAFQPHDNVLELNCGTGEDAFFLASQDISVFSCDASQQMIHRAEQRLQHIYPPPPVVFCQLPIERIDELAPSPHFEGAFSNSSGLNCIADLVPVAANLSAVIKPGGTLILCMSTRYCLIEILYRLAQCQWKGLRHGSETSEPIVQGSKTPVFYPSLRQLRHTFSPYFKLRSCIGVGVAIPPSYLEPWFRKHPLLFGLLCRLEGLLAHLPLLRSTGDHILLRFEKVSQ